jgi:hypothetical protein
MAGLPSSTEIPQARRSQTRRSHTRFPSTQRYLKHEDLARIGRKDGELVPSTGAPGRRSTRAAIGVGREADGAGDGSWRRRSSDLLGLDEGGWEVVSASADLGGGVGQGHGLGWCGHADVLLPLIMG